MTIKRSVVVGGKKTSISVEDEFWQAFKAIALMRGLTQSELITEIAKSTTHPNLSSAIRVFVLAQFRK